LRPGVLVALALGIGRTPRWFQPAEAFLLHPAPLKTPIASWVVDARPQQNIDMNGIAPATFFAGQGSHRSTSFGYSWMK